MSYNKSEHIPLSVLLKRELANGKAERSEIVSGQANQSKKGEDFALIKNECQRVLGDGVTTYSVFGIFDGHNGSATAIYTKENLLNNVLRTSQPKAKYAYLINTIGQDGVDLKSSRAEDLSVFRSQRPLSLRKPKISQSSEAEEFSIFRSRRFLNLQIPKISFTQCTFLTKYICDILH
ncbi:hypothetical protein L6452_17082 [Arctium lappa]|uniref:Uncharacterized protein n=1 Tax=Arctium lappa TaxID=4217 RepID=A0ACB9C2L0_ARCLA|nr:hypothetical protein L6452_17082 [Arctium lappa]